MRSRASCITESTVLQITQRGLDGIEQILKAKTPAKALTLLLVNQLSYYSASRYGTANENGVHVSASRVTPDYNMSNIRVVNTEA